MASNPDDLIPYLSERVRSALAANPETSELGVTVTIAGDRVFLHGQVPTTERRLAIEKVVSNELPDHEVVNGVSAGPLAPADDREVLP